MRRDVDNGAPLLEAHNAVVALVALYQRMLGEKEREATILRAQIALREEELKAVRKMVGEQEAVVAKLRRELEDAKVDPEYGREG